MTSAPRRVAPFFVLAFAITWGAQLPGALMQRGVVPGDPQPWLPLAGLGIFGPLLAAVVVTRRERGMAAVWVLLARVLRWRVHAKWYLVALLPAALLALLLSLLNLVGRSGPVVYWPALGGIVFGIVMSLVEEIGWRGFALPRLQERWGDIGASGVLGTLWYLWHLPMFFAQGVAWNLVLVLLLYFWGASLLLTWIYNGTGGSILLVSVAHLAAHLNNSHRALPEEVLPLVAHAVVYAALGLFVLRGSNDQSRRGMQRHALAASAASAHPAER